MPHKWLLTILYGLLTIWTGLWRGIEAQAYKPKALWFCLVMGVAAIAAGSLFRQGRAKAATIAAGVTAAIVLGFYLYSFIGEPEGNATFRVGAIILASIAELVVLLLPPPPSQSGD